ncbi:YtkA-like protien [Ureibacillus xyleni]|uniref:YtkA-like protien n=1 Tax=Ureibacillus xyleni TaxID=614648 RepID=A0A285T6B1_9BACL|nr:FixH family protein [Ureibacillus xyleni]SOC16909.1 YtkA-like protien [Ureibacillus xyleni]
MKKWLFSMVAVPVLLMGCSSNEKEVDTNDEPVDVEALEVKVNILTPEKVAVNEPIELSAHVTQNNENVDDAESVKFEVWESGYRDEGQMIDGELDSEGVYKAEITFDHDGVYYMFAHTTARGLHVMPKQQLIVGNPDMSKVIEDNSSDTMNHGNTEEHGETEHEESTKEENHGH